MDGNGVAMRTYASTLRAMAREGLTERANERMALALMLESQSRIEALLVDYVNRANVAIQQVSASKLR